MSKILLLEPNRLLANQYREYLEARGHTVLWSSDAQTAITNSDSVKPDIVITELLLSGHSGIEFLYEFRSYAEWRSTPAIVLTSLTEREAALNGRALEDFGITKVLYKSEISLAKLATTVEKTLQTSVK